ncbi:uncharacterized protein [Mycetomoellerius zeteki]|uniref:uncharacterized protein isoform X2 n=1 Tax=Mycetomoellerius zeteki TaxID=64791 RepID=UPI00084E65CA|nr:PREDICTED: uncharacterized protein LOC108729412 isoform X2 [Trachymyrmex zeteki]
MMFIAAIVVIALSSAVICSHDFGDGAIFARNANTNSVRPQSDSSTSWPIFNMQQSLQRSQTFQAGINSRQNDITNYRVQRPSLFLTPPKISYLACEQFFSKTYSIPRSSSQQYSMCVPQSFVAFTSYNPKLNQHSTTFSPLNIPKSSFTHLPPQSPLFSSTSARPLRSVSRTSKQLGGHTGGIDGIGGYSPRILSTNYFNSTKTTLPDDFIKSDGFGTGLNTLDITMSAERSFPPFITTTETGTGAVTDEVETAEGPRTTETGTGETTQTEDDLSHPPHIHSLDVECSKTMMTIHIEFNRAFNGVIYSKGYYANPECIYVKENSGSTRYSFTVNLDSCGTQFINDFKGANGQAYLETVLVLQNEPGIQEVWDTIRRIRCLWEGNINKALTVNLSIDMLNQEIVTFSGDTATVKLDIQIGKGPFAPTVDGLVKIGETMTLVVSVKGDPGFDLQVRDCVARDKASTNILQLTDERGCILKPKLFGTFQKTNDTGNTGTSIIAYAFFQAFKFPDVMDLFIECNVELCKTNCDPCPDANQVQKLI